MTLKAPLLDYRGSWTLYFSDYMIKTFRVYKFCISNSVYNSKTLATKFAICSLNSKVASTIGEPCSGPAPSGHAQRGIAPTSQHHKRAFSHQNFFSFTSTHTSWTPTRSSDFAGQISGLSPLDYDLLTIDGESLSFLSRYARYVLCMIIHIL